MPNTRSKVSIKTGAKNMKLFIKVNTFRTTKKHTIVHKHLDIISPSLYKALLHN